MTKPNLSPAERLAVHVTKDRQTGCWLWGASVNSNGYGKLLLNGRTVYAHRLAYELHAGPIPEGLTLDHKCRVRRCCNPAHLEPTSLRENIGRSPRTRKSHCVRGHEMAGDNLYVDPKGFWKCRACKKRPTDRPQLTAAQRAEFAARAAAGATRDELAAEFNRHPKHVARMLRGLNPKAA